MIPKRLLPQRLTYRPIIGRGSFGPIYDDPVTIPARVQFTAKAVRNANGEDLVAAATIYVQPGENLPDVGDIVTLPDGSVRPIIARSDQVGARAVEVVSLDVS
ncbi:hypothetical protein O4158_02610 [Gordonia amicalis]|uniref:hypothetical protein n=1 Tax=Gordonia TaxID=2053 RepID=UPI0003F4B22A|nr:MULTISPECIES: hypothetical protein [Gordonia]ATD70355.1 hypothetical protein CNO18_08785 [Gordonia sp. 1D]MCZ4578006.1 hypothetical protein [Gordonia amicalis]